MILLALVLIVGVVCGLWLLGRFVKELNTPMRRRKPLVVGVATAVTLPRKAWRNRGAIVTVVSVLSIVVTLLALPIAWKLRPTDRPTLVFMVLIFLVVTAGAWDWVFTGGRNFNVVLIERRVTKALNRAVTSTHEQASPGKVTLGEGEARVMVSHVGPLDPELVGQYLKAGHTTIAPTAEMGRTEVIVRDEPPPPELGTWEALEARGLLVLPDARPLDNRSRPRLGEDRYGNVHELWPVVDPEEGANILIAGATGAGKSVGITTLLCDLAWQRDVAWVGLDPHRVELKPWAPRMTRCAKGVEECVKTVTWLVQEMDRRIVWMDDNDVSEWEIGVHGPGILWIADEFAEFPTSSWSLFHKLCSQQRKTGMGDIIGTQRPEAKDVLPTNIRDNHRSRCAYGMMSIYGSTMILEQRQPGTPDPTEIPESCKGGYVLLLNRTRLCGRGYLPCESTKKSDISAYARTIADSTAHLAPEL